MRFFSSRALKPEETEIVRRIRHWGASGAPLKSLRRILSVSASHERMDGVDILMASTGRNSADGAIATNPYIYDRSSPDRPLRGMRFLQE